MPTHAAIKKMSDAEIVERLTAVRGIGPWTVEMLLIFRMGRPDVSSGDGLRSAQGVCAYFSEGSEDASACGGGSAQAGGPAETGKEVGAVSERGELVICGAHATCAKGNSAGRAVEQEVIAAHPGCSTQVQTIYYDQARCAQPRRTSLKKARYAGMLTRCPPPRGLLMAPSKRFICIHGHFYQPPRENPWLETVETQDTAAPYHDWNERICAECYATNGAARIQNVKNQITRIVNNYARISFNFGPTLLSWLKENAPRTYRMILDGERRSRRELWRAQLGHGAGVQPRHHAAGQPDATGLRRSAGALPTTRITTARAPEGMWLAETAADTESLELLAQHGIKFTLLAPHQCRRVRALRDGEGWTDTPGVLGGYDAALPDALRLRGVDCGVLLQRAGFAGDCVRGSAELRRDICGTAEGRLQGQCAGRNWCMWPRTASRMATTTSTARWRWPMRCGCWSATAR